MEKRGEVFLKAFLRECEQEKRELLTRFLPDSMQEKISSLPDISLAVEATSSVLDLVHWSWLVPILEAYPIREQKLFASVLDRFSKVNLEKAFQLTASKETISSFGIRFLRQTLEKKVCEEEILPVECLPATPLDFLLKMNKKKLIEFIDFLSLYDLSADLRQIVETKILKKIYSFLSENEKQFLKLASGYKEPYPAARIALDKWDGTKKSFRSTLHRIGLARLGSALSGQHPDFIWYVLHRLDTGRGSILQKLCEQKPNPSVVEWLAEQMKEFV